MTAQIVSLTPDEIRKLLDELRELAALEDPVFTARTQSQRVCRQAADTIDALLQDVRDLNEQIEVLGEL
jgi:hypothetical protein